MPAGFLRKYRRRKITFKKKSVDKKQNKDIKVLKEKVKNLSSAVEVKFLDTVTSKTDLTTLVQNKHITDLSPWDSNSVVANAERNERREGNSVLIKSYTYRGIVEIPQNDSAPRAARVRMMVVHTPDSEAPVITEVLTTPSAGNDTHIIDAFKKIKPANPYDVMYDKTFLLQSTIPDAISGTTRNATAVEPFRRKFNINLSFHKNPLKCTWAQGQATAAPIQGALTLFVFSDVQETGGDPNLNNPRISGLSRMRFMDA